MVQGRWATGHDNGPCAMAQVQHRSYCQHPNLTSDFLVRHVMAVLILRDMPQSDDQVAFIAIIERAHFFVDDVTVPWTLFNAQLRNSYKKVCDHMAQPMWMTTSAIEADRRGHRRWPRPRNNN